MLYNLIYNKVEALVSNYSVERDGIIGQVFGNKVRSSQIRQEN